MSIAQLTAVTLPDGSKREVEKGSTVFQLAESISHGLAKKAVAAKLDGKLVDLSTPIEKEVQVEILTSDAPEALDLLRHSTAHLMAQAVLSLFPTAKVAIGPSIADGFYYDFGFERPFTPDDLVKIEEKMRELSKKNLPIERSEVSFPEIPALIEKFEQEGEIFKAELLKEISEKFPGTSVTLYKQDIFTDLCRGPHLPRTGLIKHFKLLSVAGAYWRGKEGNPMLSRIYGTSYFSEEDLKGHLHRLEEAARRDHRKLGPELDLYSIHDVAGSGLILFHPKGALTRSILEEFLRQEHLKRGYDLVMTPHIFKGDLWDVSGHSDHYRDNMYFFEVDKQEYVIKPMNCPGHILIYGNKGRSYRELPMRLFELGTVYRYERSGVLHGLLRVRGFTQDDAHIFCTPDQLQEEIGSVLDFAFDMMNLFGFETEVRVGTKPESFVGTDENWVTATQALFDCLNARNIPFHTEEGGGAFYGPKIQVELKDALGRLWTGPTIQVDFALPERFDLKYMGSDGKEHRPIMIHRTVVGSMERFFGALIEQFVGAFPMWLAPVHATIIPISKENEDYAFEIAKKAKARGLRIEVDERNESLNYRIRDGQMKKVPYMFVVGKKEEEANSVALRSARAGGKSEVLPLEEVFERLLSEIETKALPPIQ
ncbi:MAG TPA: threonine--tRNA ligase [Cyanobacteria bacterium UBA8530]|nr:threonine--tRNA ligase [Cyanobacteria bacterium UBA8530]